MANKKWFLLFTIIIFIYLVVLQIKAIWPFTIDDMYISLRYAKHLANGQGLLWNINEPSVEGYSNFSFVILAALAIKLSLNPVIVLKFTGLIGLLLLTFSIYLLTRLWFTPILACLPSLAILAYRGQIIWSVSGFETTVYQTLICFSLIALLHALGYRLYPKQADKGSQSAFIMSGILLALASLTRPEGPFFTILFYSIAWFDRKNKKGILAGQLAFLVIYVPYFIWRLYYFGQLFPNPIYCKGLVDSYFGQIDKNYLKLAWPFFLLALPAIWQAQDRRHYYFWLPSVLYLLLLISADPLVAFENRLFLPAFVLLLPLSLKGLGEIIAYCLQDKDQGNFYQVALIIISILVGFSFIPVLSLANLNYFTLNPQKGERLRKDVATWLDKNISGESHVVLADSGLIPYYSSLAFIDSFCLNNKDMTTLPRKTMLTQGCEKIIKQKPEVIILTSLIEKEVTYPSVDACLYNYIKLSKTYRFRIAFQTSESNPRYRYDIYTALH
ncbi:protein LphB [Legionella gresilensis]|uniref:protein LphB n=1 Tax=Legionella gresilensis TaxID=91823 RepID=UPI001041B0A2|nr:protein LphB [Legionella gresilensis]